MNQSITPLINSLYDDGAVRCDEDHTVLDRKSKMYRGEARSVQDS